MTERAWKYFLRALYSILIFGIFYDIKIIFKFYSLSELLLLILSIFIGSIIPTPNIRKNGEYIHEVSSDDDDLYEKEMATMKEFCTKLKIDEALKFELVDDYFTKKNGCYGFSEKNTALLKRKIINYKKASKGITGVTGNSSEICLIGKAAVIYREIFEPLIESKDKRLYSIGLLGKVVIYFLVSNGDVQSVISKYDCKNSKNADDEYDILKQISLLDHLLNTCSIAYKISKSEFSNISTSIHMAALSGLLHDIGKHPKFYPIENGRQYYRSSDHPKYSIEAVRYFINRLKIDPQIFDLVIDAILKHHLDSKGHQSISSLPSLTEILRQADRRARQEELVAIRPKEMVFDFDNITSKEFSIIEEPLQSDQDNRNDYARPLNLSKVAPLPEVMRNKSVLIGFLVQAIGPNINSYAQTISNLDLEKTTQTYGSFTFGNDLMVRMSLMEDCLEKYTKEIGIPLDCQDGQLYPMQLHVKGLLQLFDQIAPGLVLRPQLPANFAFLQIQVQQGRDRWTKRANYVPLSLSMFCKLTGMDPDELEGRKLIEDHLAGRDFLSRICGWRKYK